MILAPQALVWSDGANQWYPPWRSVPFLFQHHKKKFLVFTKEPRCSLLSHCQQNPESWFPKLMTSLFWLSTSTPDYKILPVLHQDHLQRCSFLFISLIQATATRTWNEWKNGLSPSLPLSANVVSSRIGLFSESSLMKVERMWQQCLMIPFFLEETLYLASFSVTRVFWASSIWVCGNTWQFKKLSNNSCFTY